MFDLLIKGGHVIDPSRGVNAPKDVAIRRGLIAAVDDDIPHESSAQVISADGQYVTPGFIDFHTHVYSGVTSGINPDRLAAATGVTTWLDAGSSGATTVQGLRDYVVDRSQVRILALLNISSIGGVGHFYPYERLEWCDPRKLEIMARKHNDLVVGVKVQLGQPFTSRHGMEVMKRAREAADRCGLPLMVHICWSPPDLLEAIELMRPGDILTHAFTGLSMRVVDKKGRLFPFVREAFESGIVCDVGHGAGSFSFPVAEAALEQGYFPDTISTDIHQFSVNGPMFDLPTVMSKFLAIGMDLRSVVEAVTAKPAELLGLDKEIGSLRPGHRADISIFEIRRGRFDFYDSQHEHRAGEQLITPTATLRNGRILQAEVPPQPSPTLDLTGAQKTYHERLRQAVMEPAIIGLQKSEDFGPATPPERDEDESAHERSTEN